MERGSVKGKIKETTKELQRTSLGSIVICSNKDLLYQEAPQAYKNIDDIINLLENEQLAKVELKLKPLITYKTQVQKHKK